MNKTIKGAFFCVSFTLLTGCSVICPKQPPEYLITPLPAPPVIVRPALKVWEIRQGASEGEIVMAWRASVEQLIGYAKELERVVEGYRKMAEAGEKK